VVGPVAIEIAGTVVGPVAIEIAEVEAAGVVAAIGIPSRSATVARTTAIATVNEARRICRPCRSRARARLAAT
jgi:hypothetical protein